MAVLRHANFGQRGYSSHQAPAGAVELNRQHVLARGLRGLWLLNGNTLADLAGQQGAAAATNGATGFENTYYGPSFRAAGSGSTGYLTLNPAFATPAVTFMALTVPRGFPFDYAGLVGCNAAAANASGYSITTRTTGKLALYFGANASVNYDNTGTRTLVPNTPSHVAATYDSVSGLAGYINGALDNSAAPNGPLNTAVANPLWVGADPFDPASRRYDGNIPIAYVYDRALTAGEIAWHAAEPFAMLRPIQRRRFYLPATAVAAPAGKRPRITMIA